MSGNSPNGEPQRPNRNGPGGKGPGGPGGPRGPQNFMARGLVGWLLLGGLAAMLLLLVTGVNNTAEEVTPTAFLNHAKNGELARDVPVVLEDERIVGVIRENTPGFRQDGKQKRIKAVISRETKEYWLTELRKEGVAVKEQPGGSWLPYVLITWGPFVLLAVVVYFFFFRAFRGAGGGAGMLGSFGRSRHKVTSKEHSNITLADVAGIDEAKDEVNEIIEFLKNPKKFQRLGGRVPRGVLLIGEPGCGKTLLARAVAGEADVPFFSISGSDFVEMFVGVGASRVRDLFKQAKDSAPCIIFLDEIDAVGRRRGSGFSTGGHDEREQTLNAILVEMDGFDTNDQVIVVAATNRSDILDPALTRPGRFDRQIHVPLPDIRGRMEILKVHARKVKISPHVDLEKLARGTPMFSGADLAAIINEAAIAATLQGKDFVEQDDLEEARDKVKWGRARKSHKIDEQEKKVIAYHEAGHATVMYYDADSEPLHKVTIIPRGPALGVTFMLPEKDRHIWTRNQLRSQLRVTFGGRLSEEMFCGDISSGAAQDIKQATAIARAMVTQYGMSDRAGFLLYGLDESRHPWEQPDKLYSDETAKIIDDEVRRLVEAARAETRKLLEDHRAELERLAEALLRYETLTREEVERVMRGEILVKPTVGDLLKAEQDKARKPAPAAPPAPAPDGDVPNVAPNPA